MHLLVLFIVCIGCLVTVKILNKRGTKAEPPVVPVKDEKSEAIKELMAVLDKKINEVDLLEVSVTNSTNRELRYKAALLAITKQYGWSEEQINGVLALIEYE